MNKMQSALERWQEFWDNQLKKERVRWTLQVSPEVMEFFNSIRWTHAKEQNGDIVSLNTDEYSYTLFNFGGPIQVGLYKKGIRTKESCLLRREARTGNISFREPFTFEKEAKFVLEFLKSIAEEAFSYGIQIYEENEKKQLEQFHQEMENQQIIHYSREKQVFVLTNGMEVPVSGLKEEFQEKGAK